MTLYAAYGSNLDPARMSERCPHSPLRTTGWLTGWRLLVAGHIWRHALGVPMPVGVLIVVGLFLAELVLQAGLFGVADSASAGATASGGSAA